MSGTLINAIGVLAGACGVAGFAPQLVKVLRERETHAISAKMYAVTTTGFVLWTAYGALQHSWPLILANGAMLALAGAILVLKLKYK